MRGLATVFTVAFVFASSGLLLGHAVGQTESSPDYCCDQQQPDATLSGIVRDADGQPIPGAQVSSSSYGPYSYADADQAEESSEGGGSDGSDGSNGSSSSSIARPCCYSGGYNSSVTGPDGSYSMGIVSGEVSVSVYAEGHASRSFQVSVPEGGSATQDFELQAFPEKTAHVVGKVTDRSGNALPFASISIRSPVYGLYECSVPEGQSSGGGGGAEPAPAPDEPTADGDRIASMPYYDPGCAITMQRDGTFAGDVTPGYAIVSVYAYQDCAVTRDSDGSGSTSCGPEYLPWTRTLTLAANGTTRIDVQLPTRPGPDATVSGYLIDGETGDAIPGATISFSNQDTYAWGSATTDQDGSYSLRLRAGYHQVSVYAPGYLSWEGVVQVPRSSSDLDVRLTPGEESWGGCCWAYAEKGDMAVGAPMAADGSAQAGGLSSGGGDEAARDADGSTTGEVYEDLGGGLGPYDAAERDGAEAGDDGELQSSDGNGIPAPGLLVALAAMGAALVVALRRRSA